MQIPLTNSVEFYVCDIKIILFYGFYKLYVNQLIIKVYMNKKENAVNIRLSDPMMLGLSILAKSKGMTNSEYFRYLLQNAMDKEEIK